VDDKDVVFFPERINQKYLALHRPRRWVGPRFGVDKPDIWIGQGNSLLNFENYRLPGVIYAEGNNTTHMSCFRGLLECHCIIEMILSRRDTVMTPR
jgi:hypothetical protein